MSDECMCQYIVSVESWPDCVTCELCQEPEVANNHTVRCDHREVS